MAGCYLGERRLPGAGEADGAVAGSITSEEFLGARRSIIGVLPAGKSVTIQWQATIDPQTNQLIVNPVNTGHGDGDQCGRLPGHQHQHRHHHARHADARQPVFSDVNTQRRLRRRRRGRHQRRRADAVRRYDGDGVFDAGDTGGRRRTDDHRRRRPLFVRPASRPATTSCASTRPISTPAARSRAHLPVPRPATRDPTTTSTTTTTASRVAGQGVFSQAITLDYNTEPTARHRQRHQQHARLRLLQQPAAGASTTSAATPRPSPRTARRCCSTRARPDSPPPSPTNRPISTAAA